MFQQKNYFNRTGKHLGHVLPEGVVGDGVKPRDVLEVGPADVGSVRAIESFATTVDEERNIVAELKAVLFEEPGFGSLICWWKQVEIF